jgi:threonyl-tRNA synthetase
LLRVRGFTQDDAHIICTQEQIGGELLKLLDFTRHILQRFGFDRFNVYLSTRDAEQPEKYMGSEKEWTRAQKALAEALRNKGIAHREMKGEAVFYGPKIDINIVDALGREWQCSTIQFDFNLPKRFCMTYTGADGEEHEVLMIHRALLGAIERFFAILIEHYKGNLPTWLAPTQVAVLPISAEYAEYAKDVYENLVAYGVRSELDTSASTISYKIRQAENQKIPYMAICGRREAESQRVSVRKHTVGKIDSLTTEELANHIKNECKQ